MTSVLCLGIALIFISAAQAQSGGFCRYDSDCPIGYQCFNNYCRDSISSQRCRYDSDCSFGEVCINRRCQRDNIGRDCRTYGCRFGYNCQYDFFTRRYECVRDDCRRTGCPFGQVCRPFGFTGAYECVPDNTSRTCFSDRDCPFGYYCNFRRQCVRDIFPRAAGSASQSAGSQATGTGNSM